MNLERPDRESLQGKRLTAFDYGDARIGMAVCDELHISVKTCDVIKNDSDVWNVIIEQLEKERVDVVFVGVPQLDDGRVTPIIERINKFIAEFRKRTTLPVYETDEAFSTRRAKQLMLVTGNSKKRRSAKGRKDVVAAAIMLQDLINELHP